MWTAVCCSPIPGHIDERAAFEAIAPGKDVDGVTMHSFDRRVVPLSRGSVLPAGETRSAVSRQASL